MTRRNPQRPLSRQPAIRLRFPPRGVTADNLAKLPRMTAGMSDIPRETTLSRVTTVTTLRSKTPPISRGNRLPPRRRSTRGKRDIRGATGTVAKRPVGTGIVATTRGDSVVMMIIDREVTSDMTMTAGVSTDTDRHVLASIVGSFVRSSGVHVRGEGAIDLSEIGRILVASL